MPYPLVEMEILTFQMRLWLVPWFGLVLVQVRPLRQVGVSLDHIDECSMMLQNHRYWVPWHQTLWRIVAVQIECVKLGNGSKKFLRHCSNNCLLSRHVLVSLRMHWKISLLFSFGKFCFVHSLQCNFFHQVFIHSFSSFLNKMLLLLFLSSTPSLWTLTPKNFIWLHQFGCRTLNGVLFCSGNFNSVIPHQTVRLR